MNKDYVFNVNWEDRHKDTHTIAILAKIKEEYYLVSSDSKHIKRAQKAGYIGIPGFEIGEVYKSSELFDYFKNRILDKNSNDPCKELAETKGISLIDSFSVDEILEKKDIEKSKQIIKEASKTQEKINEIREKKARSLITR